MSDIPVPPRPPAAPPAVPPVARRDGSRLQLGLVTLALFLLVVFQTIQLVRDRTRLAEATVAQEPTMQEAQKLRRQLDTLASGTARLAADGNANAAAIIEDLRRQGIAFRPPAGAQ
jgi:hypothetical protein